MFLSVFKKAFTSWSKDKCSRLAAALSYYTIFSLAPLLIIIIGIIGLVFGQEAAQNQISSQISGLVGQQGGEVIQTMIKNSQKPSANIIATLIGVVTLLLGALGVFDQLQESLNIIWKAPSKTKSGFFSMIREKFLSFGMLLVIGFLLLTSLVLSAGVTLIGSFFNHILPVPAFVLEIINFLVSFGVITVLFAMMFRFLPNIDIKWDDVWVGAAVTSLLFTIGKFLIGLYLGHSSVGSTYGAAGSLIIILLWAYYSALILFFGAEFTKVYTNSHGSRKGLSSHKNTSSKLPAMYDLETKRRSPILTSVAEAGIASFLLGSAVVGGMKRFKKGAGNVIHKNHK